MVEEEHGNAVEMGLWFQERDQYIYAGCSGAMGALSVLLGGCASRVMFKLATYGPSHSSTRTMMMRPAPSMFVIGMLVFVMIQTHLLNRAMMMGENVSVIPVFNAFWTLFGVQGGTVFYQSGYVDIGGVILMVIGVALLMRHER